MPRLLVCYHFFHPDDVVSARMFSDLAAEQVRRGWDVTALACNRAWSNPRARLPASEEWNGVHIRRVSSPAQADLDQQTGATRQSGGIIR